MMKPYRIRKFTIENIKGISKVDVDLTSANKTKDWLLLFGDNGYCKTTILKCLALALGDKDDASGMFKEHEGNWVRRDSLDKQGRILVEFEDLKNNNISPKVELVIKTENGREFIKNRTQNEFSPERMFACGYGAGRGPFSGSTRSKYRLVDAVYSLFDYQTELQEPEVSIRRLEDMGTDRAEITRRIDHILMLEEGSTTLDSKGLSVATNLKPQLQIPFLALSDGYKSVMTIVSDFLGRAAQHYEKYLDREKLFGIFLIDEIDQHLHPNWQRRIIKLFSEQFPNVQFIATTHSPTCALGSTDLEEDNIELAVLQSGDNGIHIMEDVPTPRGRRIDQILSSVLFQMDAPSDDETQELIEKYARMSGANATNVDKIEFARIKDILDTRIGTATTELEEVARKAVNYALDNLLNEAIESLRSQKSNPQALRYAITQQLIKIKGVGVGEDSDQD